MTIDPRLSYRALGLLLVLQATEGAETRIDTAALFRPERREGRDAVRATLAELAEHGYVATRNDRGPGGKWLKVTYLVSEKAQVTPKPEKPVSVDTPTANPQVEPKTEKPVSATPETGKSGPRETPSETFPQVEPKPYIPMAEIPGISTYPPPPPSPTSPTSVVVARTHAHTHARPDLQQLAANAIRHDTWRLIHAWRNTHTPPYRNAIYDAIAKHADDLLSGGADPAALAEALQAWDRRPDARPGLLPHLYDDALKQLRAARAPAASPVPAPEKPATGRGAKGRAWLDLAAVMEAEAANQPPFRIIDGGRTA